MSYVQGIFSFTANIMFLKILESQIDLINQISTSNYMFGRVMWDKLPKCIFENNEIS